MSSSHRHCNDHNCCIKILAVILTGEAHPRGSKNLAIVDRMAHLFLAGDDGTVTRNWKISSVGFHSILKTLRLSSWRTLWDVKPWSVGSRSDNRAVALLAHFRRWKPLITLSIDRVFVEQEFDRLRRKRNHRHMSDDVKREPRAEMRHLHRRRVDLGLERLSRERRLCHR